MSSTSKTRLSLAAAGLVVALGPLGPAHAADDWRFAFTPYLWASGMKGEAEAGNLPRTRVDMQFTDIMETLDFGLMGQFEARKDRWGLMFDAIYMKLSDSAIASRTGPNGIVSLDVNAKAQIAQSVLAGAVAYRVLEVDTAVDVFGGLRYTNLDIDAKVDAGLFGLSGQANRHGDKDWVDPYIGVRVQHPLAERWTLVGLADVGGFGVGADSTWQVSLGAIYEVSESTSATFGYRYYKVDYDEGDFLYNMESDGLYVGMTFHF